MRAALEPISHYFGFDATDEGAERFAGWLERDRMHAAWEGGEAVAGAGAFGFQLSVPGGARVPTAGVSVVAVRPSHRRRGLLTSLMRAQLDEVHERGDAAAYLWASEGHIYRRFGYGLAGQVGEMALPREHTLFAGPFEPRGACRWVDHEEAARVFPVLYEAVAADRPGFVSRSDTWWRTRRLADDPARRRGGPLTRVLLELDGQPAGYALYRVQQEWRAGGSSTGTVTIVEALAPTAEGTRELWRWLLDFDWTSKFSASLLPLDHPLFVLLAEPRRLELTLNEGPWLRLVDAAAALSARAYAGEGEIVLELSDPFCPWNEGRWRVNAGGAERTSGDADLRLDAPALGSVYLGGFRFGELRRGCAIEELTPGAAARADALFGAWPQPWCPEIF